MANRLINEASPYLLQHAHNPVDWYPWGQEAFAHASAEDRPILLSIGYSACHWCHVMERESFEDEEIARLMNDNFVNVKVDREERPDLDSVYMSAVQAMTGRGGWPLTVFLTPDGQPFFGGTYFPVEDRNGMPGFARVLQTVIDTYRNRRSRVESTAREVASHLRQSSEPQRGTEILTPDLLNSAFHSVSLSFDRRNGGFGFAPKFPQAVIIEFLLRYHRRTGDEAALAMAQLTLRKMATGGIYDQIGGGFHRYSVDSHWLVPHFEKMLYDNALLGRAYLHAHQITGDPLFRRVVEETLDYVLREMTAPNGGFYSTQDADSEGVEGRYYTWTPDELVEALGLNDARLAAEYFGVTERGDIEGFSLLKQAADPQALATQVGAATEELERRISSARSRLLQKREHRPRPHRDTKILADWNGLMLATMAEAAAVLDREDYLRAATTNARFLKDVLCDGPALKHLYIGGGSGINGFLSDYALVCEGMIALYRATLQPQWLRTALGLADEMLRRFQSSVRGVLYDTGPGHEKPVVRPRNVFDNAVPSGPSAATHVLLHLARLTGSEEYELTAAAGLRSVLPLIAKHPSGFGHWLCALDYYLTQPLEIAIAGDPEDASTKALLRAANRSYLPNRILAGTADGSSGASAVPLLHGKVMVGGRATAYVCENRVCGAPVSHPDALASLLDRK